MKKIVLIILSLILMVSFSWAQFYTKLKTSERKQLAEAYYLVGNQYEKVGKTAKGKAFKAMAFNIYPNLVPEKIKMREYPTAEQLLARYNFQVKLPQRVGNIPELIKSKFIRLISNLIAEDANSILDLLDGSIYIDKIGRSVNQKEAKEALKSLFSKINLIGLPPSEVFDINSFKIYVASPKISKTWGKTYILEIRALKDFSDYIGFWEKNQKYFFHKRGVKWVIYSIGSNPPPFSWRPQKPFPVTIPASVPTTTGYFQIKNIIKNNFLKCIGYFLKKDTPGAMQYIDKTVYLIRLRTTITQKELETSFKGYFENTDFSGITINKIIDENSIFIIKSNKFEGKVPGPVYLLNVKTRMDLSNKIPFWTRYQEYFFREKKGNWKIFAIF